MGQRATDTPPLQPAQEQPQRRVRASAAHTNTTTESDQFATAHKHMVNTTHNNSNDDEPHGPTGSHPLGDFPATSGKAPIYSQKFGKKSV